MRWETIRKRCGWPNNAQAAVLQLLQGLSDVKERWSDKRVRRAGNEQGMTLVEIMVVVMIIGLVVGAVSVAAFRQFGRAKERTTRTIIANVESGVQLYMMENNDNCPKDLYDLYREKILKKPPKDAWGEDLTFKCPGEQNSDGFDVVSKGPDKQEGTEDDLTNFASATEDQP